MSISPVKFAIIGRGTPAHHRFDAIHQSQTSDLVAALDTSGLRSDYPANRFPVHPSVDGLRLASPKPSVWLNLDEQSIKEAVSKSEAVVISDPRLCTPEVIKGLINDRRHLLVEYLPTSNSEELDQLYELANKNGVLHHLSCVTLQQGVPLTLSARVTPVSVKSADLTYKSTGADPDDISELVYQNIGALLHLVSLTDRIRSIVDITYHQRVLRAEMRSIHDAVVTIAISQTPDPDSTLDFSITDHATTWRQMNDALYQGRSPQTILQGMHIYQDDLARFTRTIRTGGSLHPSQDLWRSVLKLADGLTHLSLGALDLLAT